MRRRQTYLCREIRRQFVGTGSEKRFFEMRRGGVIWFLVVLYLELGGQCKEWWDGRHVDTSRTYCFILWLVR